MFVVFFFIYLVCVVLLELFDFGELGLWWWACWLGGLGGGGGGRLAMRIPLVCCYLITERILLISTGHVMTITCEHGLVCMYQEL